MYPLPYRRPSHRALHRHVPPPFRALSAIAPSGTSPSSPERKARRKPETRWELAGGICKYVAFVFPGAIMLHVAETACVPLDEAGARRREAGESQLVVPSGGG